jgi:hypothetical protein
MAVRHWMAGRYGYYILRSDPAAPGLDRTKRTVIRDSGLAQYPDSHRRDRLRHPLEHRLRPQTSVTRRDRTYPARLRLLRLRRRPLGNGPSHRYQDCMDRLRGQQRVG